MQASSKPVDEFSLYVRNLDISTPVTELEELLYELFLQAGPLSKVYIPSDRSTGYHKGYGFVEFMHKESLPYAVGLLDGIKLHGRPLTLKAAGAQNTPSTPNVRVTRQEDSPIAMGNTSSDNPFQQALSHSHPTYAQHQSTSSPSPHAAAADLRFSPVELQPPHGYLPMGSSPHGYPPMGSPHGYPPMGSSPHGYHHVDPPFLFSPHHPHPYPLLPPPPPLAPPTPGELERSHHRHHEARLHSRDHPHWLKEDVRDRLSHYHQREMERPPRRLSHEGLRNHYH